jgi:N6-L-threonylcarbamoyladenine synthase
LRIKTINDNVKVMKILGIETSCDETGVCLIETQESNSEIILTILGNQLYSQIEKHKEFGGVFPMLAKREHAKNLVPLLEACLKEADLWSPFPTLDKAGWHSDDRAVEKKIQEILSREYELFDDLIKLLETIEKPEIDAIAVTNGPGLEPALWVGVVFAKALNQAWNIPIIPTNHMEGHIVVSALDKLESKNKLQFVIKETKYPAIALLISGGHTQLVLIKNNLNYEIVGGTRDDAVGEAYDKVARMLGLPYPGGKIISDLAQKEKAEFPNKKTPYPLPRPMIKSSDLNFSFSGLKTAVLYTIKKIPEITTNIKQEIALEFENSVLDVLENKTSQAIEEYNPQTLIIGGGVSANTMIKIRLEKVCQKYGLKFLTPEISASTDNALMIAVAGFMNIQAGKITTTDFKADGNLSL